MKSMTGYGKGSIEKDGRKLIIEMKSVNHRYLDLSFKMPRIFNFAEDFMRKLISSFLSRGHIDIYVNYEDNRTDKESLSVNESLAANMVNIAKHLSELYGVVNNYSSSDLMKSPDVLIVKDNEDDEDCLKKIVEECLTSALQKMTEMREIEGKSLEIDIKNRVKSIGEILEKVKVQAPFTVSDYKTKLNMRMKELLGDVVVDEARLLNEIAFFSDKVNIDEEIARLRAHINHFNEICSESRDNGRKLDFVVQEMNREVNTMGSKANDLTIVNAVVLMKNEIEKIREQIQNIE